MHHVRTQAPYGLFVGLCCIIFGDFMSGYVWPEWVGLLVTVTVVCGVGFLISAPVASDKKDVFGMIFSGFGKKRRHEQTSESGASDNIKTVGGEASLSDEEPKTVTVV